MKKISNKDNTKDSQGNSNTMNSKDLNKIIESDLNKIENMKNTDKEKSNKSRSSSVHVKSEKNLSKFKNLT